MPGKQKPAPKVEKIKGKQTLFIWPFDCGCGDSAENEDYTEPLAVAHCYNHGITRISAEQKK